MLGENRVPRLCSEMKGMPRLCSEKKTEIMLGTKAEIVLRANTRLARREEIAGIKLRRSHGSADPGKPY